MLMLMKVRSKNDGRVLVQDALMLMKREAAVDLGMTRTLGQERS